MNETPMDINLRLREIRRLRGLSQKDVARLSGVGEKTISSFETGQRIDSLKLSQLERMLGVYGLTESEFFGVMPASDDPVLGLPRLEQELDRVIEQVSDLLAKLRGVKEGLTESNGGALR